MVGRFAPGEDLTEPLSLNTETLAGPLRLTVTQVQIGDAASQSVLGASSRNTPPGEGLTYAVASLRVVNDGARPVIIDGDDFGFATSAGRLRRALEIVPPAPVLSASLTPGEQIEGWVAGIVEDGDPNVVLVFTSRDLGGRWVERYFALQDGAVIAGSSQPAMEVNDAGTDPGSAATIGQSVATPNWVVTISDVVYADDVFNLYPDSDYRTTALGSAAPELIPFWIGVQVEIQNNRTGGLPQHFPVTAFGLAFGDGAAVPDVRLLSAPLPDLSGDYFPGGRASGWVTIELPAGYGGSLLRFQPYRTDADVRYLTWGDGAAPSAPASVSDPTPEPDDVQYAAGTEVVVIESDVNMRDAPSASGEVLQVLSQDTALVITGGPEEADGYSWYRVQEPESGLEGFVAANFLRAIE